MPVILRSPATHAAAVVGLEKAIREIADIVWDAWHGAIEDDYDRQVARRGDKSIGEGDPKPLPPGLRSKLDQLQRHLVGRYTDRRIGAAVDSAGEDVHRSNRSNLDRQVETAIGKRFRSKPRIGDALRSYRAEAIRRITSVRDTVIPTITKDVAHAYSNGWTSERLAKHWEDNGLPVEYGTVEGRARVIAASELGRLNMHVTREAHRELGIESYRWRHSGKAKFRPTHKARDKSIFSWKKPPSGGHPGNEPGCGCGADAVLDEETIKRLSEADENTAAAESPPAQSGRPPARVALQPAAARLPVPMEALAQAEALAKRKAAEEARRIVLAEQEAARVAEARAAALAKKRAEEAARRQAAEEARHQAAKLNAIEEAKREAIEREVARQRAELGRQASERQAVEAAAQRAAEELAAKRAAEAATRETTRRVALEESRVRELARTRAEAEAKAQVEAARAAAEAERKRVVEAQALREAKVQAAPKSESLLGTFRKGKIDIDEESAAALASIAPGVPADQREQLVASLISAHPDDVKGKVSIMTSRGKIFINAELHGKDGTASRVLKQDERGWYIENAMLAVPKGKRYASGYGTRALARQIEAAESLGIERIKTYAAGGVGEPGYNGYYTWPRLGYDGPLPDASLAELPATLRSGVGHPPLVSDLMRSSEGREWWKKNGRAFDATFDPRPGSRSRRILEAYQKERDAR